MPLNHCLKKRTMTQRSWKTMDYIIDFKNRNLCVFFWKGDSRPKKIGNHWFTSLIHNSHGAQRNKCLTCSNFRLNICIVCTFSFTKASCCVKLTDASGYCYWQMGISLKLLPEIQINRNSWFILHKLQHTKMLSALELPFSLCDVTDWERREWYCACIQDLNTCCFIPCRKNNFACFFKAIKATWNYSNYFSTQCINCMT